MNKSAVKKGDTFAGTLRLYQTASSQLPPNVEHFYVAGSVKGPNFSDIVEFTAESPGVYKFSVPTQHWEVGNAVWDIEVSYRGEVVSIPHTENMIIEVIQGV